MASFSSLGDENNVPAEQYGVPVPLSERGPPALPVRGVTTASTDDGTYGELTESYGDTNTYGDTYGDGTYGDGTEGTYGEATDATYGDGSTAVVGGTEKLDQ